MGKSYTEKELIRFLEESSHDMNTFCQQPCLNYCGVTKDGGVPYTEIVARYLLANLGILDKIKIVKKKGSYKTSTHNGKIDIAEQKGKSSAESMIQRMYGKQFFGIGKVIDYKMPLRDTPRDKGVGKVDIVSETDSAVYLLGINLRKRAETLLKSALVAFTCVRVLDRKKFLKDFNIDKQKEVKCAVLVVENSAAHREYTKKNSATAQLMKKLEIGIFAVTETIRPV